MDASSPVAAIGGRFRAGFGGFYRLPAGGEYQMGDTRLSPDNGHATAYPSKAAEQTTAQSSVESSAIGIRHGRKPL